ncbi:MAG: cyclase family protein [Lachnospiraceae bacterium]|nr:cyclase family protein [Lachnospiraceae bacterium]
MDISFTQIIDLTLPITTGMSVPPGNRKNQPPVEYKKIRTHEDSGIQVGFFSTGIHAGTHLDAPLHTEAGKPCITELPLDYFIAPAYCIDCSEVKANEPVTAEMLEKAADEIRPGMHVYLYTGWTEKYFGKTDDYWSEAPYLGEDAAWWLVRHGAKIACYDFFQEIAAKNPHFDAADFHVHHILLGNGCLNMEHATNLSKVVGKHFTSVAFPIKIEGAEGAATRAIALL